MITYPINMKLRIVFSSLVLGNLKNLVLLIGRGRVGLVWRMWRRMGIWGGCLGRSGKFRILRIARL
jgi:hypothetical protein